MHIVSYNIQAAIASTSYLSYVSRLHRQVLPSPAKSRVLSGIARYIGGFDIACLQEIDLGGLRNGFRNQAQQLLAQTPFAYSLHQTNRKVGRLSLHGNLILSRFPLECVADEPLPSRIKGRGILAARVETGSGSIVVANVHLSLGAPDQFRQIHYICRLLDAYGDVCLMGDFNCPPDAKQLCLLTDYGYERLAPDAPTYPSWKPKRALDHIFVKGSLKGLGRVNRFSASDHLPVEAELFSGSLKP